MHIITSTIVTGLGATALIDLWALARRRLFGVALPDYGMVGRWLGHMPRGRFLHPAIRSASPVPGELLIGWGVHYLIGVAFAGLLALIWGAAWFELPSIWPALAIGIATVAAPFLLMQPGLGLGIAARFSPKPWSTRLHSLVTHTLFGIGLYAVARALHMFSVH